MRWNGWNMKRCCSAAKSTREVGLTNSERQKAITTAMQTFAVQTNDTGLEGLRRVFAKIQARGAHPPSVTANAQLQNKKKCRYSGSFHLLVIRLFHSDKHVTDMQPDESIHPLHSGHNLLIYIDVSRCKISPHISGLEQRHPASKCLATENAKGTRREMASFPSPSAQF